MAHIQAGGAITATDVISTGPSISEVPEIEPDKCFQDNVELEEGEEAFAKIVTEDRAFYMKGTTLIIGRDQSRKDESTYFCICEQNTVSKLHAQIDFNENTGKFQMKNLSKNRVSFVSLVELFRYS